MVTPGTLGEVLDLRYLENENDTAYLEALQTESSV